MTKTPSQENVSLIVDNVRGFAGRHEIPIRPLTIFVGENSSGKTTAMAALSLVSERFKFPFLVDFNAPPFQMGGYETIATYRGGRAGREESFSLGYSFAGAEGASKELATFVDKHGEPLLTRWQSATADLSFSVATDYKDLTVDVQRAGHKPETFTMSIGGRDEDLRFLIWEAVRSSDKGRFLERANRLFRPQSPLRSVLSIAPIRTRPQRTYSELSSEYRPEGDHIPVLLSRILGGDDHAQLKAALIEALQSFGEQSELFTDLTTKRLGKGVGSPFQIQVKSFGPPRNMADVGYGVSQSLPIVVQCVLAPKTARLLIQQPEVHLHPRAQAALGTFFVKLVTHGKRHLVLETHSDFVIDRVRQEVAARNIDEHEVLILYFEKSKADLAVFPIQLDNKGNLLNAPSGYRRFFLQEELNLLSRGS